MSRYEVLQNREMKIETSVNWLIHQVDIVGDIYMLLLKWDSSSEELETKFRQLKFRLIELGELARSKFIGSPYLLNTLLMKSMGYADKKKDQIQLKFGSDFG